MIGHIGVNVVDLERARRYYAELMPLLGFEIFIDDHDQFAYRPTSAKPGTFLFFYPAIVRGPDQYSSEVTGLQHLAFMVPSRLRVHEVRDLVVSLGSDVIHEPAEYPQYPPPYYAVFWRDPSGLTLEAVCHHDR